MNVRVVAIFNQKGGVGKTTTSTNLSHALAKAGKKVTVIDFDPQGHLSVSLGMLNRQASGIDAVLLDGAKVSQCAISIRENLRLIPSGPKLHDIELMSTGGAKRSEILRHSLLNDFQDQDYVLIDCPPSSGLLVANVLFATDEILIPMTSDFLALQGLSDLIKTIRKFEHVLKKKYKTQIVMARYTSSRKISKEVLSKLQQYFPQQILATVIRESAVLSESTSFGKTIFEYRPKSTAAQDFQNLAKDFLQGKVM